MASILKKRLTRAAYGAELFVERAMAGDRDDAPVIEPYLGYSTPDGMLARGRVLSAVRRSEPVEDQSILANLKQMTTLFLTDEVSGVTVRAADGSAETKSDAEGYFTLTLEKAPAGWHDVEVETEHGATATVPVLVTDPAAEFGVISDIDDTIMKTGAYSLARNLWTTFTGSALTRQVFPDAVNLLNELHDGKNPVFFVSSSPWNLHHFLQTVFDKAGVVKGPKFLRDLGFSEDKFGAASHGSHKGAAIDTIMAANPDLEFVLIGDTGQHDAEVYAAAAERHPGRVRRVILRAPGPGADGRDKRYAGKIADMEIDVSIGRDYASLKTVAPGEKAEPSDTV